MSRRIIINRIKKNGEVFTIKKKNLFTIYQNTPEFMKKESIHIQHAENGGEIKIPEIGKVDGYCKQTNTIYEFHGSYWHGKRKNIELFLSTLLRDNRIRNLGYNLLSIWEHRYVSKILETEQ